MEAGSAEAEEESQRQLILIRTPKSLAAAFEALSKRLDVPWFLPLREVLIVAASEGS